MQRYLPPAATQTPPSLREILGQPLNKGIAIGGTLSPTLLELDNAPTDVRSSCLPRSASDPRRQDDFWSTLRAPTRHWARETKGSRAAGAERFSGQITTYLGPTYNAPSLMCRQPTRRFVIQRKADTGL
jgi:hypothetical protein